jgi:hypothetical protein
MDWVLSVTLIAVYGARKRGLSAWGILHDLFAFTILPLSDNFAI